MDAPRPPTSRAHSRPPLGFRVFARLAVFVQAGVLAVVGSRRRSGPPVLMIESGVRGWDLLEYQELIASAREAIGEARAVRLTVSGPRDYLREVRTALAGGAVTHYLYDPRSCASMGIDGLWLAARLSVVLARRGIVPIARIPDFAQRRWRLKCALVTARSGVVVGVVSADVARRWLGHRRYAGPLPMAMSLGRVTELAQARASRQQHERDDAPRVVFTGSLYEPRTSFLTELSRRLEERGIHLHMHAHLLGEDRDTNDEYWGRLLSADIVVTTAVQAHEPGADRMPVSHLVYRYTEAPAAGAVLVAPVVEGADGLFTPDRDFAAADPEDAARVIALLVDDAQARRRLAEAGHARVLELATTHAYWRLIDQVLGPAGLLKPQSGIRL